MLYVIQKGFNFVPDKASPQEIVYCIVLLESIISSSLDFIFCDGHPTDRFTHFYSKKYLGSIEQLVDKKAVYAKYWRAEEDLDLKRRKQAEFLIKGDVEKSFIGGYVVYNESAKRLLNGLGIPERSIAIKPFYYFDEL